MIGRTLSHYRILAKLGEGGMGEVFLAEDTELGREVALKVLATDLTADSDRLERFRREAKAVAALNHPNIVTIHSIEESEGIRFLTMERVEGQSLDHEIPRDGLPLGRFFDLAIPLADALAAAHAKGIVHRDLKPANVMVTSDGRVKVLDFGLAKLTTAGDVGEGNLAHAPTRSVPLTGEGMVMGTVPYMSPEQLQARPVDHRSDIFSLGVVLYEMATGRRPFAGESGIAVASSIVRDMPRPVSELRGDVPRHLARIIHHCLEKDPEDRSQSAKDVRNELRALREEWKSAPPASAPSAAAGSSPREPAAAHGRARWAALAAGVVLAIVAGVWLARRGIERVTVLSDSGPKRIAVLPFENLGAAEDGYFADGMTEEVRSKLAGLAGLAVIARASADQYKGTTKSLNRIAEELGVRYLLTATVRWQKAAEANRIRVTPELVDLGDGGSPTTRWQAPFEANLSDVFRVQSEIATQVAAALELALSGDERGRLASAPTSNLAAYDAYLRGREIARGGSTPVILRAEAEQLEKAVALDPAFAQAWAQLSLSQSETYRLSYHEPKLKQAARVAAERALELDAGLADGYAALGDYFRKVENDPARAREVYRKGLSIAPDDAGLVRSAARGFGGSSQREVEEILRVLLRARDLDPRSWETELQLGTVLVFLHRSREAREALERGLALAPGNLTLINWAAQTYLQEGDLDAARKFVAAPKGVEPTALVAYLSAYGDLDWVLAESQRDLVLRLSPAAFDGDRAFWAFTLAEVAHTNGDVRMRSFAEEAVRLLPEQLAVTPDDAQRRVFYGMAFAFLGQKEAALREAERGAALRADNRYVQHQLARVYILVGERERALDILERLLREPYSLTPAWLRVDPNFDPLRGNPRFDKLARGD